jgi:hypothetical protein
MARKTQTISQRLALEGGKEIRKEFEELGEAGERAFQQLQEAINASSTGAFGQSLRMLQTEIDALGEAGKRVGSDFGQLKGAFGDLGKSLLQVGKSIGIVASAASTAAGALFVLAKSGANAADAAGKAAAAVGLNVQAYTGLQFAAEQSGVASEAFAGAMGRLNRALGEAANGSKSAVKQFADLGVKFRDAKGKLRPTEEVLGDIADKFARMPDGAKKSAAAIELFGRSGASLIPFLNEGRAGIAALVAQAELLGLTFTKEQVKVATAMNDSLSALTRAVGGIKNQIGLLFAPDITRVSDGLISLVERNREAIVKFAATIRNEAIGTLRDFVNALSGNEAAVDRAWIVEWTRAVKTFGSEVQGAFNLIIIPAYRAFVAVLNTAAAAFNSLFGSNLSGGQLAIVAVVAKFSGALGVLAASLKIVTFGTSLFVSTLALLWQAFRTGAASISVFGVSITATLGTLLKFGGIAALVVVYFDEIKAGAERLFQFLGQLFTGDFSGAWETFKESGLAAFDGLKEASALTWGLITVAAFKAFTAIKARAITTGVAVRTSFLLNLALVKLGFAGLAATATATFVKIGASIALIPAAFVAGFALIPALLAAALASSIILVTIFKDEIRASLSDTWKGFFDDYIRFFGDPIAAAANALRRALGLPEEGLFGTAKKQAEEVEEAVDGINRKIAEVGKDADLNFLQRFARRAAEELGLFNQDTADKIKDLNRALTGIGEDADPFKKMADEAGIALRRVGDDVAALAKASGAAFRVLPEGMRQAVAETNSEAEELGSPLDNLADEASVAVEAVNAQLSRINAEEPFARVVTASRTAFDGVKREAATIGDELEQSFVGIVQSIEGAFRNLTRSLTGVITSFVSEMDAAIRRINNALASLAKALRAVKAAAKSSSSSSSGGAEGFASGGYIRGPGTSTSDSIPAWLSSGEYVARAASVRHYGPQFFSMLNSLKIPKRELMAFMASLRRGGKAMKFSTGGMVSRMKEGMPAFSTGGLVDAMSRSLAGLTPQSLHVSPAVAASGGGRSLAPVTIDLGGGREIGGLFAPIDVVDELMRAAGEQQLLSTGNIPAWRGRR